MMCYYAKLVALYTSVDFEIENKRILRHQLLALIVLLKHIRIVVCIKKQILIITICRYCRKFMMRFVNLMSQKNVLFWK